MSKFLDGTGLAELCRNIKSYILNAVPTKTSELTNDSGFLTDVAWNDVTNKPTFATVATSGNYTDLSGKPSLATVATSGSYTDLSDKPTIPTVPSAMTASEASTGTSTTARTITAKVLSDLIDAKISEITDGDGVSY